jgi:hypothetical protein
VLKSYAEYIFANGGTALYDSVLYSGNLYELDIASNNVIFAMTDGQDGSLVDESTMNRTIRAMAKEKGVTLYTLGLGDSVDYNYLKMMAVSGNGSYLYVSDKESLTNFYDFLHARRQQIAGIFHHMGQTRLQLRGRGYLYCYGNRYAGRLWTEKSVFDNHDTTAFARPMISASAPSMGS